MYIQQQLQDILTSRTFQQTAPLVVLFAVPAAAFFASRLVIRLRVIERLVFVLSWCWSWTLNLTWLGMGLESFGVSWLWAGSSGASGSTSGSGTHGRKSKRKTSGGAGGGSNSAKSSKAIRTRADQIALQNLKKHDNDTDEDEDDGYYAGLALASLSYLQPQIDAIQHKAEVYDVPTPVIDALQDLFKNLNTPKSSYHSIRPHGIIAALSSPPPQTTGGDSTVYRTSTSLFNSREHQDAQELFQLVTECIKNETAAVDRESQRDRGIAGVLDLDPTTAKAKAKYKEEYDVPEMKISKNVFDGLTANRRSCVICGYTEAVMHFGFDNWQLAMPRLATSCRLEDCLEDYTRLEILKDCVCRNCTVLATHKRLLQELKSLEDALENPAPSSSDMPSSSPQKPKPSNSKKKRYKEVKRMEQRLRKIMEDGRIEDDSLLEGIRLEKVVSPASTKQAMIARPPPVLALHLNRSVHYGHYAAKNTIKVIFPEVLDITPYTTSGSLSTVPTSTISTPPPPLTPRYYQPTIPQIQNTLDSSGASSSGSGDTSASSSHLAPGPKRVRTPTPETYAPGAQRTIYRLSAVVCHFGQHSFGHYICYRRKPRRVNGKWMPPTLIDPLRLELEDEALASSQDGQGKKANGSVAAARMADYAGSSTLGETRYYWEDRTEEDVGTGRGWLRISDDSVTECGIESVLAEGTGAFMLYYEKAVHPRPGVYMNHGRANGSAAGTAVLVGNRVVVDGKMMPVGWLNGMGTGTGSDSGRVDYLTGDGDGDGDSFSIGSEETLKPEMRVMNLNGSVGSLVSEVGVGVMKSPKKEKKKLEKKDSMSNMSMSLTMPASSSSSLASAVFGARIVRSVNARRRNTPESASASNGSALLPNGIHATDPPPPSVNGSAAHEDDSALSAMTASAPSILPSPPVEPPNQPSSSTPKPPSPKKSSHLGHGSKSTKVMHSSPPSVKVKAR
uniref:ubiquitinyl hydrolase 1 n=1 Tax=Psilocybe cubensis TaxID=181762 RepID=A0A8H8CKW5_PSICU